MNSYIRFPNFKSKAVTLSYDDGVRQDKRLISIMQKYGLKGTFNINGGQFGKKYEGIEKGRMTEEEALELYKNSQMEVAVHGYKHLSLAEVDSAVAVNDVVEGRKTLESTFGGIIKGMAYANGSYSDDVVEILKSCGISYCRTTISTEKFDIPKDWLRLPATCHHNNPKLMELAKTFIETPEPEYYWRKRAQLFYLWGHSYEFDDRNNWDVIERFAEYVGGREEIWYATNGEIYDYICACNSLQFSVDGKVIKNPTAIDVYISYYGIDVLVPAGQTVMVE